MSVHVRRALVFAVGLTLTLPAAALTWTSTAAGHGGHGHNGSGRTPSYRLLNGEGAAVELWLPTLDRRPVQIDARGVAHLRPSGMDYYHALVAKRGNETAVRYIALRGRSSGESPKRLLEAPKAVLEIIPDPYPREHQPYYGGRPAAFRVRFRGEPAAGQTVALETGNGTRLFANTDAEGRVVFPLPADFETIKPGRRANPPAEFTISTAREGHRFSLTAEYHVDPRNWQSTRAGAWSGIAGFAAGLALLGWRRRGRLGAKA